MGSDQTPPRRIGILCEIHNLHFNPQETWGCALCRREAGTVQKKGGNRIIAALVGFVVLVAGATYLWQRRSVSPVETPQIAPGGTLDEEQTAGVSPQRLALDPSAYRPTIDRIESVLYQEKPPDYADISGIVRAGRELAEEIRKRESHLISSAACLQIITWSASVDQSDVGYAAPNLADARSSWESLRSNTFRNATWFRSAGPDTALAQSPRPARVDPEIVQQMEECIRGIRSLGEAGQPESDAIGEILGEVDDPESREIRRKWLSWAQSWGGRIRAVSAKLPKHPGTDADVNVVMAYQSMNRALSDLRNVTVPANDYGVPFLYERNNRFQAASQCLADAASYLQKIQK